MSYELQVLKKDTYILLLKEIANVFTTMNNETPITLRDIKKLRLERHWSQEQLAEMSGLSIRTIQRIEKGENAGLESLKSLAAVFETIIADPDTQEKIAQARKEEAYIQNLKGLYKLVAIAIFSLVAPLVIAINDASYWFIFLWFVFSWVLILGIYSLNVFDFLGEAWKQKMIAKKFKK